LGILEFSDRSPQHHPSFLGKRQVMEPLEARLVNRRAHDRVDGPFDGRRIAELETPVRIWNLSEGGCFVNSMFEQPRGAALVLRIDLPDEDAITLQAEAIDHRADFGFAVRFTGMTDETRSRLGRVLERLRARRRR
jgi:hypothetical protein